MNEFTVYMSKSYGAGGTARIEIFPDRKYQLGRCRGKGDYIVRRPDRKLYRMKTFVDEVQYWKGMGFKVDGIYVEKRRTER